MKAFGIAIVVLIAALVLKALTRSSYPTQKNVSFEEQLKTFEALGFELNEGVLREDVLMWEDAEKAFVEDPWNLLYMTLGLTIERAPWTPITNQCWDFDLEAIEDHGAYVDIMKNISRITDGDLDFEDLTDYVDVEAEIAWVAFKVRGDAYKWNLRVDNDWADGDLFDRVQALAIKYETGKRFTYYNTGGQDFVLGYHTEDELSLLRKATGLNIEWLKAKGQIY